MAVRLEIKNSFAAGELAPELHSRSDSEAFSHGAAVLKNVLIRPGGGVTRRPGCELLAAAGAAEEESPRLFEFVTQDGEPLILLATATKLFVYDASGKTAGEFSVQFGDLRYLHFTAIEDGILLTHKGRPPKILTARRESQTEFVCSLIDWEYMEVTDQDTERKYRAIPFARYAPSHFTIAPSHFKGQASLKSPQGYFVKEHVGTVFRVRDGQIKITRLVNKNIVIGDYIMPMKKNTSLFATDDWAEQAFSPLHGWPGAACIYRGRLCLASGGGPPRVRISKAGSYRNFTPLEGLEDEPMAFTLSEAPGERIVAMKGGQHLKIFTDRSEWIVGGEPFTLSNLQLRRYSKIGSAEIPKPVTVDSSTIFCGRHGNQLRRFFLEDNQNAYRAEEISRNFHHLLERVVSMAYCPKRRLLVCCAANGKAVAVTMPPTDGFFAASGLETLGRFRAVATIDDEIHFVAQRGDKFFLEKFNDEFIFDHATFHSTKTKAGPELSIIRLTSQYPETALVMKRKTGSNTRVKLRAKTSFHPDEEIGLIANAEILPLKGPDDHLKKLIQARLRFLQSYGARFETGGIITNLYPLQRAMKKIAGDESNTTKLKQPKTDGEAVIRGADKIGSPLWRIFTDRSDRGFTLLSITMEIEVKQ